MVTVSHIVKKYIDGMPFVAEAISRGIISNPGLAEELQPKLEKELGKNVKMPAIVMALRRYAEEIDKKYPSQPRKRISSELVVKSGLCVVAVRKSPGLFRKLHSIYRLVSYEKGDALNVSHGNNEVSIIINGKYAEKLLSILRGEGILRKESDLVAINIVFSEEYFRTPGVIFAVTRQLAWNNINIVELVSAHSELSVLVYKKHAAKAYEVLQEVMS